MANEPKKPTEGAAEQSNKPPLILARELKKAGQLEEAKKHAITECESLIGIGKYLDAIHICAEFGLPPQFKNKAASGLLQKAIDDGKNQEALNIVERYRLPKTDGYVPAVVVFKENLASSNLYEATRLKK